MRVLKQEKYFPMIIMVHFCFWAIDLALYKGDYGFTTQHVVGEIFSSWVITVFAANFLMATRARWVEKLFGGLDKMYLIHRRSGLIAIALLVLHFLVVPRDPGFTIGKPLGLLSLVLILIGVFLSASPPMKRLLSYKKWRYTHMLMGIFYIIGITHALMVPTLTSELPIVRTYVFGLAGAGVICWFYKAFLYNFSHKKYQYTVSSLKAFKNDVLEIVLTPLQNQMSFQPGQFAFAAFGSIQDREYHPFTISSHPSEDTLRLTIKALGDYTAKLQKSLSKGVQAKIRGPYGRFNFKNTKYKKQLWLAGGIGITPFLSFFKEVNADFQVKLIWAVKASEGVNYNDEIKNLIENKPNIDFLLHDSETKHRFNLDSHFRSRDLEKTSVLICGPERMRESYIKQLLQKGVCIHDIHYEEFGFR